MRRPTIGDVAAQAGVSTATVSRVLNGGAVTEATAARVLAAVSRLEYTPNALTRSIFAGHASTIGVVIRDLASPFYLDLIRGIDEVAAANDSLVLLANTFRRTDREQAQVRALDEQRVRGLIVTTGETADGRTRRMAEAGTPCVVVTRTVPGMHSVRLDNVAAGRLMAGHLVSRGRRSVVVVAGSRRPSQVERTAGLRAGLAEHGVTLPAEAVAVADAGGMSEAVGALLARSPDAVVCLTGRLTMSVYSGLTGRGMTVPDDMAFLTMDDFPWAEPLGVTVVSQPAYEMGRRSAELVVDPPAEPAEVIFAPSLITRGSC